MATLFGVWPPLKSLKAVVGVWEVGCVCVGGGVNTRTVGAASFAVFRPSFLQVLLNVLGCQLT